MAKKSNEEIVKRVDKQDNIEQVDNATAEQIDNTTKVYTLVELRAIAYPLNITIEEVIELLKISDNSIKQLKEHFKTVEVLVNRYAISTKDAIMYLAYKYANTTQG